MNRREFMKSLREQLSDMLDVEREEALEYYEDYLNDAGPEFETTYQENPIAYISGYWTLSSNADISYGAWDVYYYGTVYVDDVDLDSRFGARPVINLKI